LSKLENNKKKSKYTVTNVVILLFQRLVKSPYKIEIQPKILWPIVFRKIHSMPNNRGCQFPVSLARRGEIALHEFVDVPDGTDILVR
jgi:hypothetical protein